MENGNHGAIYRTTLGFTLKFKSFMGNRNNVTADCSFL